MKLRDTAMVAMMTAVIAVLGLLPAVTVPFLPDVPVTAQTLGVMLAGIILGARRGAASCLLFILLIGFGAHLLSGGRGGPAALVGPTAGYLWAWPVGAFVIGYLTERTRELSAIKLFAYNVLGGVAVIYAGGIPVVSLVTKVPLAAAAIGNLVYIPGDLVKAVAAAVLGLAVRRALSAAGLKVAQSY